LIRSVAPLASSSGLYCALRTSLSNCFSLVISPVHSFGAPSSVLSDHISCSSRWNPVNWDLTVTGFSQRPSIEVSRLPQISAMGSIRS